MQHAENLVEARKAWVDVLDRFQSFDLDWRGSRFETYLGIIDHLVELAERRKTDPDAYREFRENLGRQELLFEGASQMLQLEVASKVWDRLDRRILARKLTKVREGGPIPRARSHGEDAADEPRDTLVELQAAALMAECGFEPALTANDEDLRLLLAGHPDVLAECKRPVGMDTLPTTLSKVRRQFWKRQGQGASLCIPVLAVERVHRFAGALRRADTSESVDAEVLRRMEVTIEEIKKICAEVPKHGLGTLAPIGVVTFAGAVLVKEPTTHVYRFATRLAFDTGREQDSPGWLIKQLRHTTGLLREFVSLGPSSIG